MTPLDPKQTIGLSKLQGWSCTVGSDGRFKVLNPNGHEIECDEAQTPFDILPKYDTIDSVAKLVCVMGLIFEVEFDNLLVSRMFDSPACSAPTKYFHQLTITDWRDCAEAAAKRLGRWKE